MRQLSVLFLLTACNGDDGIKVLVIPPAVTIQTPTDNSSVNQNVPVSLRGFVTDSVYEDSLDQLDAVWNVDGTPICEGATVSLDGYIDCTHTFTTSGEVTLSLAVNNPDNGAATSEISLNIIANTAPSIDIVLPQTNDGPYYSDYQITFASTVSDNEDDPSALVVSWESDLDGTLSVSGTPDSKGYQEGSGQLTPGEHTLIATVTDTTGLATSTETTLSVNGPNNAPNCEITAPLDGDIFEEGDPIQFIGTATDNDIDTDQLTVVWDSDKDGELSSGIPASDGETTFTDDTLSLTNHTITLTVTDEIGATCSQTVTVKVGSGPDIVLVSPASGDLYNEGDAISFEAEITDNQDDSDELSVSWISDIDGEFSTQGADSSGVARLSKALEIGNHVITVSATDTDKLTSTASANITVNDLPSAPSVSIDPDPPSSAESFSASIDSPSLDAEGHTITYNYAWTLNGGATSYATAAVPASATARGEVWEVTVTPNDGYGDGETATASTTVGNAAPVMASVGISPDPATVADTMSCSPSATDNDGDSITYSYAWYVNSKVQSVTGTTLSSSYFSKGDDVYCEVTPNDGTADGTAMSSSVIEIDNAVPEVASASVTPTTAYEATVLTCSEGATSDDDGDKVTVSYAWAVNSVTISPTTATLTGTYFDKGDTVSCAVTPNDGTDDGSPASSNTVTINNTLPEVASASLTPTSGVVEGSTLTCSAGATSDDDPADSVGLSYAWTIDGATISATGTTLTGTYFDKGDIVACVVTPSDGADGASKTSNTVSVGNTAPSASSVKITPASAYTDDDLVAEVSGWSDVDSDTEGYTYAWYVEGSLISGVTAETLDYTYFVKDDEVYVIATPYDGTDSGSTVTSATKSILNTPPEAPTVLVAPTDAEPEDDLECTITTESYDEDGDPISYSYAWTQDSTTTGITSDTVDYTYTADDETWTCTATPNDGDVDGTPGSDSQVVADRTAPNAPVIDAIDRYRNATSVTLDGTAEGGSSLLIYFDCDSGTSTTTITVPSSGSWTTSTTITQGDDCDFYAYATDDSGNTSGISNTVSTESCATWDDHEDSAGYGDTCSTSVDEWSTLADDGSTTISFVGNIIDSTDSDWYYIDTSQSVTSAGFVDFNLEIEMVDGTSDYAFTVYKGSCSTSDLQCDDSGTEGDGYTTFDYYNYDDGDGGAYHLTPSDTTYCNNSSRYDDCTDYSGGYYIHVYRPNGGADCTAYELEITNGL